MEGIKKAFVVLGIALDRLLRWVLTPMAICTCFIIAGLIVRQIFWPPVVSQDSPRASELKLHVEQSYYDIEGQVVAKVAMLVYEFEKKRQPPVCHRLPPVILNSMQEAEFHRFQIQRLLEEQQPKALDLQEKNFWK